LATPFAQCRVRSVLPFGVAVEIEGILKSHDPAASFARACPHRGLHDASVAENSMAFRAAIDAGYGIELDIQPSPHPDGFTTTTPGG
jgi:hypothetical protein